MTIDKSEARVRRMFGEIAGRYDFLNHLLSLNIDKYWRWRTVRRVPPVGHAPILDLCTGTGDLAFAYLRAAAEAPVIGADFCRPMLEIAERKGQRAGVANRVSLSRLTPSICRLRTIIFRLSASPLGYGT